MMNPEVVDLPVAQIKPMVSRARARKPFERMRSSIAEHGIHRPLRVRPLTDGGKFKYELIWGEGRLNASRDLNLKTVPAVIVEAESKDAVGMFLIENLLRRKMSWQAKARLLAQETQDRQGAVSKAEIKRLADKYFITPPHVVKLLRILSLAAPELKRELDSFTVEEAEQLTSLPAAGQEIVIETMREENLQPYDVPVLVRKAKELRQTSGRDSEAKELSKRALRQSLRRLDEDLERQRKSLKLKRLHFSLGPENLRMLLSDATFRRALDRRGINYRKFEEAK